MKKDGNYYIVHKKVLPDVLKKTVEVNAILERDNKITINETVNRVGMSRSAYYKYKDYIQPFFQLNESTIATIYFVLDHTPGILSQVLNEIAKLKGNILTINQNIPLQGMASVTISIDIKAMEVDLETLTDELKNIPGVLKAGVISKT